MTDFDEAEDGSVPRYIWPSYQAFYIQSMLFNTTAALRSVVMVNSLLATVMENSPDDPCEALPSSRFLGEIQNFIVHAAAISRYFWPVREGHEWRGAQLRNVFSIADDSPLRSRDLRNAIEHFDEKLDRYLEEGIVGQIIPEYIGPFEEPSASIHLFRAFYVDRAIFQLLDKRFEINPIVAEISNLHQFLQHMDRSGETFNNVVRAEIT